jgi:hypothetical protein
LHLSTAQRVPITEAFRATPQAALFALSSLVA